jgi:hypothetical protein
MVQCTFFFFVVFFLSLFFSSHGQRHAMSSRITDATLSRRLGTPKVAISGPTDAGVRRANIGC